MSKRTQKIIVGILAAALVLSIIVPALSILLGA